MDYIVPFQLVTPVKIRQSTDLLRRLKTPPRTQSGSATSNSRLNVGTRSKGPLRMSEGTATIEDAVAVEAPARKRKRNTKRKKQPRYHVVLWDDNDHSYSYVIMMLRSIFGHEQGTGLKMAKAVDSYGRVICLTTTREHAELKRDQIKAYGRDFTISRCKGSMSATIEPEVADD